MTMKVKEFPPPKIPCKDCITYAVCYSLSKNKCISTTPHYTANSANHILRNRCSKFADYYDYYNWVDNGATFSDFIQELKTIASTFKIQFVKGKIIL